MNEALERLNSILNDTIILRTDFSIEALGSEVQRLIKFSISDLYEKSLLSICESNSTFEKIKRELNNGYFSNLAGCIATKEGERIEVMYSGFYLGLISDLNGYIVLKVRVVDTANYLKGALSLKNNELDSFIYRAAHDLRGPLATIKGLVNLLKVRRDDCEVNELTALIELHANKLDDRLFKLLYMSDLNGQLESPNNTIRFSILETMLRGILADNCHLDNVSFNFAASIEEVRGVNENISYQLISNLLLYIVSLPVASVDKEDLLMINIDAVPASDWLELKISSFGFMANQKMQSVIKNTDSLYTDLLINPFLFNYYVAHKRAKELKASLAIQFHGNAKQVMKLRIPIRPQRGGHDLIV